ncbi:hypothetical protein [Hyunsoonleella pacifica]|uniref:Carboxypeptidase-like regulatory domain-containing protein n=1 Tax=Hyunsoonleella pacifica TaxID=1080224 RepID=A0A4Q9FNZ2_9FLAO|nr:hypothetical protein [Hyunsoonleella pacifica]TBN15493.1 hypothetical protein EYD46_10175 [Hyunsoonleella pacifica]GGD24553.1 hypothetical protein GCM10011368_28260 [Hyunsoonleella pacifica]
MKLILLFIILFSIQFGIAQSTEITGVVKSNVDVENIHVINKTAQKFTVTDSRGKFTIPVSLNDTLSFSSVQYQPKIIIVSQEILESKTVLVILEEQINELEKITLRDGLSGDLTSDMTAVKLVKPTALHLNEVDMSSIRLDNLALEKKETLDHYKYILNPDTRFYQPDIIKIIESVLKIDMTIRSGILKDKTKVKPKTLLEIYNRERISKDFNVPMDKVDDFLLYIEKKGFESSLLEPENMFLLVEFLMNSSEVFNRDGKK